MDLGSCLMFNINKIGDFFYIESQCNKMIEYYKPVVNYDALEKASQSMQNMQSEQEARLYIYSLIIGFRRYHIEFLMWREKPQYLPLILNSIKYYNVKFGK